MAISVVALLGLCLITSIVVGAGAIVLVVFLSGQRRKSEHHD